LALKGRGGIAAEETPLAFSAKRFALADERTIQQKGGQKPPVHESLQSSGLLDQGHPIAIRSFFILVGMH
jgi:hypothetical protein